MKKITHLIAILIFSTIATAQTQSAGMDHNNTNINIMNGGDFFWDLSSSKYQVPKNTSGSAAKSTIFSGAVWIGGEEEDGTKHLSAMTYRQRGQDYWSGPKSDDTTTTRAKYDKIWSVTAAEIDAHIINSTNPIASISSWPGNGDTTIGEPFQLAPFVDVNKNGVYEPTMGDYPKIKGIAATYCVYTDQGRHTETGGIPLGVDIHQLFYQDVSTGFEEVNLASFTIINRSDTAYQDFKFGIYVDFDLGNFADDFVGSDSAKNMIYAYNGDNDDDGALGYGLNPPSQNMMFLNTTIGTSMYYNNNMNPINGSPRNANDFYNYLSGKYKNGSNVTHPSGYTTKHFFSGDPVTGTGWTETTAGNTPADRRMLAVAKETSLAIGEIKCYDIAFVYGRATSGGATGGITKMKAIASKVQSSYDGNTFGWKTSSCKLGAHEKVKTAGILNRAIEKATFAVYPNPSTGVFHIKNIEKMNNDMLVTDTQGKIVKTIKANTSSFDLRGISNGIYFLKTENGTVRLIKM